MEPFSLNFAVGPRRVGKVYPRKERKLILRDPLIVRAMELWTRRRIDKVVLYEWLVLEHLHRKSGERRGRYPRDVKVLKGPEVPGFLYHLR